MQLRKQIEKAIFSIDNTYPDNNFITSYKDFLKQKDFLIDYQFNPVVFNALLSLTNSLWKTDNRISRLDLLLKLKQYLTKKDNFYLIGSHTRPYTFTETLSLETRKKLFELFKNIITESKFVTVKQFGKVRGIANNLLINVGLTTDEEKWLCDNIQSYPFILNRILRYPKKSTAISSWARKNFTDKLYVTRRAELISWLLDEDQSFEIDNQRLLDDFEIINQLDKQAIKSYRDDIYANEIIERELGDILPRITYNDTETGELTEGRVNLESPKLELTRRPYSIPIDMNEDLFQSIPDFKKMSQEFYDQIDVFKMKTMIWAIGYSRLNNKVKTNLFKKYFSADTVKSVLYAAKKTGNSEILKWILNNKNAD